MKVDGLPAAGFENGRFGAGRMSDRGEKRLTFEKLHKNDARTGCKVSREIQNETLTVGRKKRIIIKNLKNGKI